MISIMAITITIVSAQPCRFRHCSREADGSGKETRYRISTAVNTSASKEEPRTRIQDGRGIVNYLDEDDYGLASESNISDMLDDRTE